MVGSMAASSAALKVENLAEQRVEQKAAVKVVSRVAGKG